MPHRRGSADQVGCCRRQIGLKRLRGDMPRVEGVANCRYVKLKCIVLDNRARPYATREIVLGDELAGRANQNFDDVECATADRDGSSTGQQFTASKIDLPLTRLVHQSSA